MVPVVIGSAACGSSSIIGRPSGPAPASANTSIRSPARSREPAATRLRLFSSSWKDRVPADARDASCPASGLSIGACRSRALNFAWHRLGWPPIETLAGGEYDIAHSPHPLLLPSRSAAQIVTIHDLHFLSHPERTSAEIRRDYPALVARPRPPRRSHHRRLAICRRRSAAPARRCRQSASRSAPTARRTGRRRRCRTMRAATCCSSARSSRARMSAGCSTPTRGCCATSRRRPATRHRGTRRT